MRTKIAVRGLTHEYMDVRQGEYVCALRDLDLEVREGEFFCVVGPSGCGKTTLLFVIAGLFRPSRGAIAINDRAIEGPGSDRGMVFQDYALLPWKTVIDNVAFGLKIRGVPRKERYDTARRFIDMMDLGEFEDRYPHQLSGGMKQRVAVARTLAASPEVMLLDEPFAAVDAQTRMTLQEELTRVVGATRVTAILVTHSVEEAVFLGDRVAVLTPRPGRLKEIVEVQIPRSERRWSQLGGSATFVDLRERVLTSIRGSGAPNSEVPGTDDTRRSAFDRGT
jgi:NitT/TauT family transport system ATP-binding protein